MASVLFSVVIPVFNRRELLARTLETVWKQQCQDYEVIIVDDGSTDGTQDFVGALGARVTFLQQGQCGPGAARNLALRYATGRYAAFLDSDDLWFPWTLEVYARLIREHEYPAFLTGRALRFVEDSGLQVTEEIAKCNVFPDYFASGGEWRWYGLSSFVVDRAKVAEVGGFAEGLINGEDADLAMRLGIAQGFVQVTAPVCFGYREHARSVRHDHHKTVKGIRYWLKQEEEGRYPGGDARRLDRWRILSPHVRANSFSFIKSGLKAEGWELYWRTLRWQLTLGRWRYLLWFPFFALLRRS